MLAIVMFRAREKVSKKEQAELIFKTLHSLSTLRVELTKQQAMEIEEQVFNYLICFYDGPKREKFDKNADKIKFSYTPYIVPSNGGIFFELYWGEGFIARIYLQIGPDGSFSTHVGSSKQNKYNWEDTPGLDYAYPRSKYV